MNFIKQLTQDSDSNLQKILIVHFDPKEDANLRTLGSKIKQGTVLICDTSKLDREKVTMYIQYLTGFTEGNNGSVTKIDDKRLMFMPQNVLAEDYQQALTVPPKEEDSVTIEDAENSKLEDGQDTLE